MVIPEKLTLAYRKAHGWLPTEKAWLTEDLETVILTDVDRVIILRDTWSHHEIRSVLLKHDTRANDRDPFKVEYFTTRGAADKRARDILREQQKDL